MDLAQLAFPAQQMACKTVFRADAASDLFSNTLYGRAAQDASASKPCLLHEICGRRSFRAEPNTQPGDRAACLVQRT